MSNNLKLIAQDEEQLTIISSLVQDSIIKSNEMGYDNNSKRFALLMNRYRNEENKPSRVRSAMHFDYVGLVKSIGIDKQSKDEILVLLAIRFVMKSKPSGSVFLEFADNKSVTFDIESIDMSTGDWLVLSRTRHMLNDLEESLYRKGLFYSNK